MHMELHASYGTAGKLMELSLKTEKSGINTRIMSSHVCVIRSLIKIMSEMLSTTTPEVTLLGTPSP